jgi:hypothetical protein
MPSRLKERASINDQIKMLAQVAKQINNSPQDAIDTICDYCNFNSEQTRIFMAEYQKPNTDGDDPLEV